MKMTDNKSDLVLILWSILMASGASVGFALIAHWLTS
jgi:hypothetical protein